MTLLQIIATYPQLIMIREKAEVKPRKSRPQKNSSISQASSKFTQISKSITIQSEYQGHSEAMEVNRAISEQTQTRRKIKYLEQTLQKKRYEPNRVFKQMLATYEKEPALFEWRINGSKICQSSGSPLLFSFVDLIVQQSEEFLFDKSEKIVKIFDGLVKLVKGEADLSEDDLQFIREINEKIWNCPKNKPFNMIIEHAMNYFMQVLIIIIRKNTQIMIESSKTLEEMLKTTFKGLILSLQKDKNGKIFKQMIRKFLTQILTCQASEKMCEIPLFDFTALSLASQHYQFYQEIVKLIFGLFDKRLDERKLEKYEGEEVFKQECSKAEHWVFMVSNIFHYSSIFSHLRDNSSQNLVKYPEEIMILVLFNYKKLYLKVLEELQLLSKGFIPDKIIRNIFKMAEYCYSLNNKFPQHLNIIQTNPKLSKHMRLDKVYEEMTKEDIETFKVSIFHKLLYTVQKLLENCDFQRFLDLYIERPVFVRDFFIENIFYHNKDQILLRFMVLFTKKWLLIQLQNRFNFNFFLMTFLDKCINNDSCQLIGAFLKQLEVPHLLKINEIIFQLSFEEEKKNAKPESSQDKYQLAYLTSAGFADKYSLVNKIFPDFSEQLVWKQTLKTLFSTQNFYFIYVKVFYNVVYYQFNFSQEGSFVLHKILIFLENSIHNQSIQRISSVFHFLSCVCFGDQPIQSEQSRRKMEFQGRLLEFLIQKSDIIVGIYQRILKNRQSAMMSLTSLNASLQKEMSNIEFEKKLKRLNTFLMESITHWIQRLRNISQIINHRRRYEDILEAYKEMGKGIQFCETHLQRVLSSICSSNIFENMIESKIEQKVINKRFILTSQIMYLKEIMATLMNRYGEQAESISFSISGGNILDFYQFVLYEKLEVTREREQLKQKLIVLENLAEIIPFFMVNQDHQLAQNFDTMFDDSLKKVILEIALHNPEIIGKYERELIIHLRITAIRLILLFYGTSYSLLDEENFYGFVFELCVDKAVEIRLMVLNIMISRFKTQYRNFQTDKHRIASFLTFFCIFQPTTLMKIISRKVLESIKKACEQNIFFGFEVLMFSMKIILNDVMKSLRADEDQFIYIDKFCKGFDDIWFLKKQVEYITYLFMDFFVQEKKVSFVINQLNYKRYGVTRQVISRQKQDIMLEQEMKDDMKFLDFEFPPEQAPDMTKSIKNIIETLPFKTFDKIRQIIVEKGRPVRFLKTKKDILIHWKYFEERGLVTLKTP